MSPSPNDATSPRHPAPNDAKPPNDANKPAHQRHVTGPRRRRQACPPTPRHRLLTMTTTLPKHATSPPCHQPPTMPPSNPTSPVPDDPNNATSPSQTTHRMVGWGDWSSCEEGRTSREDGQGDDEVACIPHAVSYPFLRRQGSVHLACHPIFFGFPPWRFPPLLQHRRGGVHPTRCLILSLFFVDGAVCTLHTALFSLVLSPPQVPPPLMLTRRRASHMPSRFLSFFLSMGRCAPCTPSCFHSFILPGGPPGRSTRQRASHMLPRSLFFFFIDGGGTRPHSGSFPPLLGGFFFFPRLYCQRGRCMTHPPLSLCFPPFIGGLFFCSCVIDEGAVYNPPAVPSLVKSGEMFFFTVVKHTGAVYYPHAAPHLSYVLSVVNVLNKLKNM